jgi:hypothetical protein
MLGRKGWGKGEGQSEDASGAVVDGRPAWARRAGAGKRLNQGGCVTVVCGTAGLYGVMGMNELCW